ncbi:MAG: sensor histidine kinase [Brumimicrobium sp.]|nr:sensor histidine kinase [Brumimicrobium sp.]MCO5267664.1 sensor histidine kinase [Brumimicrobium sp.]
MMKILNPNISFDDYREQAKFLFIWRLMVFSIMLTTPFTVSHIFIAQDQFLYFLISLISDILIIYFLWKRPEKYRLITLLFFSSVFLIAVQFMFTLGNPELNVQAFIWMMMVVICTYFTAGSFWGTLYLVLTATAFSIYYFTYTPIEYVGIQQMSLFDKLTSIAQISLGLSIIGYTMFSYHSVNTHAFKEARDAYLKLKEENERVEKKNNENIILLQEVHHRVKNNLQVIISLLRIQSSEFKSQEAKIAFQDTINRVLSMSLIHQKIYQKESMVDIDLEDYLKTLLADLLQVSGEQSKVRYEVHSDFKSIDIDKMVPFGLIVNELLSNSLKHAFNFSLEGDYRIVIDIKKGSGPEYFSLNYLDNGVWKEGTDKSFGLQLIDIFTEQLNGKYRRVINEKGTQYEFEFGE